MSTPQTEVILRHAGAELARVTLPPGEYIIGRDPSAGIYAETPLLSRKHALLTIRDDAMLLEDLRSSNGTFVAEQPLSGTAIITPGQPVRLGDVTLEVWRGGVTLMPAAQEDQSPALAERPGAHRYAIGAEVARGGMGAILEAQQNGMDRRVAMKVMLENPEPADVARFVNEAKITGQLEHPNIVPVHELGIDEHGQHFYTMKFVRGITLKKVLELLADRIEATVKKYPLPALLTIFQKACDAIAFAHAKGVIHRDLKPENIMLGDFGEVLVMDWGLAKNIADGRLPMADCAPHLASAVPQSAIGNPQSAMMTLQGSVMGTPQYMAPEQARGEIETMDERADIYALGAILYHMLALRPSVGGEDAWTIVTKVARGEVDPLVGLPRPGGRSEATAPAVSTRRVAPSLPRIPDSLVAVVRKAMALDRAQRYATVADLQADLTAYQSGFATSAEKAGLGKQLALALKRHKAAAAGIAAVLIVGTVFGTHALIQGRRAEQALTELKKSAPAFAAEADSLLLKGDVPAALARLDTATQLDPDDARWPGRRGQILDAALRFPEAAAAYTRAAALDPKGPWSAAHQNSEKIAAARQPDGSYSTALLRELYAQAIRENRTGDALLLATPLKLAAKDALPLWQAKVDAWLGKNAPRIKLGSDGSYSLNLERLGLTDLTPLQGMPLNGLGVGYNKVSDLSPLAGMPLRGLNIERTNVSDLSPLTGMRLNSIALADAPVTDLSPLRGMPLNTFTAQTGMLTDISPLSESPLTSFVRIEGSRVSDLSPLAGIQITYLWLPDRSFPDLSVLRGMPLKELHLRNPGQDPALIDILLSLTRLEMITISSTLPGFERLRTHPSLKRLGHDQNAIAHYPSVADYWRAYDARRAERQQYAVHQINVTQRPDGTKRLEFKDPQTREIPPLDWTGVSQLNLLNTAVSDLSPIRGVKLRGLAIQNSRVSDLSPLRGSPIEKIAFMGTPVTDVSPLLDCPNLEQAAISRSVKNVEVLRQHPKLRHLGYTEGPPPGYLPETTVEEFWKIYDAKKAGQP